MILVFEMTWTGTMHAPGNANTLQTIARAMPDQDVRFHAEPDHIAAVRGDAGLRDLPNVTFHDIAISRHFRYRTQIVSLRRFACELAILRAALRAVPRGAPCLLVLMSATPTAILAARLLVRRGHRRVAAQIVLHGNLNDLNGWRPRNPLRRIVDLRSLLAAPQPPRLRFLVLEACIRRELAAVAPPAAAATDVLPHPVNLGEVTVDPVRPLEEPLRIGLVGLATEAKGLTPFLQTAQAFRARHGGRVAFDLVGQAVPGSDLGRFAVLDHAVATERLPRAAFIARLSRLHFVFLPIQPDYYRLSASGALIDAITWLKPVIVLRLPIVEDLFSRFGDIGYLCDDLDGMRRALEGVLVAPDAARYARQVEAMRQARAARLPQALAAGYRAIVRDGFADLLPRREPAYALADRPAGRDAAAGQPAEGRA